MTQSVQANQPLIAGQRRILCMTAILKNEASYLEEWLAYHRAAGIEHFFLFDNNSDDDLDAVLAPWISHGVATLLRWPLFGGQIDAYNFALRHFGHMTEWMAFLDIDEFVVPRHHATIPAFLETLGDADQVLIPWRNMGYAGHRERPAGLVIENFTLAQDIPPGGFARINCKGIIRPAAVVRFVCHHGLTTTGRTVNERGEPVPETHDIAAPSFEQIQVNHYYTKSYAEMQAKVLRGQGDGGAEKPVPPFDRPGFTTKETTILERVAATKAVLQDLHRLAPNPFRYGARLGLRNFPRRDPMIWLQRVVLSNHISRTPQVQMAIPVELRSLAGGTALVVRGEDHGWAGQPGALEQCIHIRDLIRRLQAATVWSLGTGGLAGLACRGAGLVPSGGGSLVVAPRGEAASVVSFGANPDVARCYSAIFAIRIEAACELTLSLEPCPAAPRARIIALPSAGTYLGIVEIAAEPLVIRDVILGLGDPSLMAVELLDLMILSYG